ncbi:RHS repeat-associated core domain-containing protein [Frateuria sp. MAH-13]|uniref:RHS repeat-associated core domain-containing protein n=1 Tax=Frateuria flava TaxID=2821489 RepID=A0ABS4DKX4_9GAMM|nr:RHS repeat-associated core domain-containing protein [Frateuria flava]
MKASGWRGAAWARVAAVVLVLLSVGWGGPAPAAETTTYVLTDVQGTVLAREDAQGNIIARYDYRPYGKQQAGPVATGPGYTGHVEDPDTGLVYMQQRYYDPEVGRFLSVDPVTAYSNPIGAFNRYWYASDNPYKFTDPDGRSVLTKLIKLGIKGGNVAATVGGIVDDVNTLRSSTSTTGEKLLAGASLLSEVVSPVSIGDAKDVAKGVRSAAERYSRKGCRYNSNNPAAKAARQAAEGQPCPKCGETMVSGTRTSPQAQHEPPLSEVNYEHGGAGMSSAEKKAYSNNPESLDGANCAQCQSREGAQQRQYVQEQERNRDQ